MKDVANELKELVLNEKEIKKLEEVTFEELVNKTALVCKQLFGHIISSILEKLDDRLFISSWREGEEIIRKVKRTIYTLSGPVSYYRRYYKNTQTGKRKFLLDEFLGINTELRVSGDVSRLCAGLNALGLAYRPISDALELIWGERFLSHEGVRQHTLAVAREIGRQDHAAKEKPIDEAPRKDVPTLFIEADGFWVSEQRKGSNKSAKKKSRNSFEVRTVMVHEGWEARHKGDFQLKGRRFYTAVSRDDKANLWEEVREDLLRAYNKLDDIQIVINGDGDPWIRGGVEYFGKAIYQYDRFHISRDIRSCLRGMPKLWKRARKALEADDIYELHPILTNALTNIADDSLKERIRLIITRVEKDLEYIIDYRKRINLSSKEPLLRGMGAAETSVKRYKKRLKSVGKAWSIHGAHAVVTILSKYFSGQYGNYFEKRNGVPANSFMQEYSLPLSAAKISPVIKGKKLGAGAINGRIAPLRGCYSGLSKIFNRLTAV